jgi:hypothetical protein
LGGGAHLHGFSNVPDFQRHIDGGRLADGDGVAVPVAVVNEEPVPSLVRRTAAFGTAAPEESVTVPTRRDVVP